MHINEKPVHWLLLLNLLRACVLNYMKTLKGVKDCKGINNEMEILLKITTIL